MLQYKLNTNLKILQFVYVSVRQNSHAVIILLANQRHSYLVLAAISPVQQNM